VARIVSILSGNQPNTRAPDHTFYANGYHGTIRRQSFVGAWWLDRNGTAQQSN